MPHLVNEAARLGGVLQFDGVPDAAQAHAADHVALVPVEPDRAFQQRDLHGAAVLGIGSLISHKCSRRGGRCRAAVSALTGVRSARSLPRIRAIIAGSFSESSPAIVARTTLCGFADPSDLVMMLVIPADSTTARTAPPAMMPVPSGAGLSSTLPAPKLPTIAWGMVLPCSGTRIRF